MPWLKNINIQYGFSLSTPVSSTCHSNLVQNCGVWTNLDPSNTWAGSTSWTASSMVETPSWPSIARNGSKWLGSKYPVTIHEDSMVFRSKRIQASRLTSSKSSTPVVSASTSSRKATGRHVCELGHDLNKILPHVGEPKSPQSNILNCKAL